MKCPDEVKKGQKCQFPTGDAPSNSHYQVFLEVSQESKKCFFWAVDYIFLIALDGVLKWLGTSPFFKAIRAKFTYFWNYFH